MCSTSPRTSGRVPGSGRASETGGPGAPGLTINFPLPPGATADVAIDALDQVVAPAVDRFAPTWVLVSAGFDAHRDDPLADLMWSAGDYAALTHRVASFAPTAGRLVAFLEGGYDLAALQRSVAATVAAMAGADIDSEAADFRRTGTRQHRARGPASSRDPLRKDRMAIRHIVVGLDGSEPRGGQPRGLPTSRPRSTQKSSPSTRSDCSTAQANGTVVPSDTHRDEIRDELETSWCAPFRRRLRALPRRAP